MPGTIGENGQPLDPKKVETQAQNLNLPGRIALPALLANAQHERNWKPRSRMTRSIRARRNSNRRRANAENFQLVPGQTGFAQFSTRLLEERLVTRSAMKAPTTKSALDSGNVNATNDNRRRSTNS